MAEKDESDNNEEPIIRDKRKIDLETGEVRRNDAAGADAGASAPGGPDLDHEQIIDTGEGYEGPDVETSMSDADLDVLSGQADAHKLAEERLVDLQRVTAEYANYRKRTEANRRLEQDRAKAEALTALLPILDDLDRAQKHGDLEGESAFATIAAKLRAVVERAGLTRFGEAGEEFDHNVHEAIFQQPSAEVTVETVADVVEPGYSLGGTLVRAAKVVVAVPQES